MSAITTLSQSYVNCYGGDPNTFTNDSFIWASHLNVKLNGPSANRSGIAYVGKMRLGSLFNASNLTVDQLIKISSTINLKTRDSIDLNIAINNTNLYFQDEDASMS